jgi:YHS domain-containing protein
MSDVNSLMSRIDAEFAAVDKSIKSFQQEQVAAHQGREQRMETFHQVCDRLKEVWKPRLEALAKRFGEKVQVTPQVTPSRRAAEFAFRSPLAEVVLKFNATTDFDVRNLILNYDLHILPILMKYESHAHAEFPLEDVDPVAVGNWLDDRIVDFVKTYLALHQNEYYLKGKLETDPVSGTQFPKYAAADTLEHQGKTYYFIGTETRREFQKQKGLPVT